MAGGAGRAGEQDSTMVTRARERIESWRAVDAYFWKKINIGMIQQHARNACAWCVCVYVCVGCWRVSSGAVGEGHERVKTWGKRGPYFGLSVPYEWRPSQRNFRWCGASAASISVAVYVTSKLAGEWKRWCVSSNEKLLSWWCVVYGWSASGHTYTHIHGRRRLIDWLLFCI